VWAGLVCFFLILNFKRGKHLTSFAVRTIKSLAAATKNKSGLEFSGFLKQNAASSSGLFLHSAAKRQAGEAELPIN
jgi:hypothetical protein